jgi:hypothetical protein
VSQGKPDQWGLVWDLVSDAEYQRAIVGLRAGLQLCLSAYRDTIPDEDLAADAIGDFVNWACALDERLDSTDATYAARRDADDDGRVLPALRFVRDRLRHRMAVTSSLVFLVQWSEVNPKPAITRTRIYWRPLEGLTEPINGHDPVSGYVALGAVSRYVMLRAVYEDQLEGREPPLAMAAALRFLGQEVKARGIEVSDAMPWPVELANDEHQEAAGAPDTSGPKEMTDHQALHGVGSRAVKTRKSLLGAARTT